MRMRETIYVKGTAYEVGYALGRQMTRLIRTVLDEVVPVILKHPHYGGDLSLLRAATERNRLMTEEISPDSLEYVQGMAHGAGVPFEDLLIHIFVEELNPEVTGDRCSSLVVWTDRGGWAHGHQEDYKPRYVGRMFVCVAEIAGKPRTVSLNFPASLLHLAGSLNECNVSCSNNAFWQAVRPGVPKQSRHFEAAMAETGRDAVMMLMRGLSSLTDHFFVVDGRSGIAHSLEVSHPDHVLGEATSWKQAEGELRMPFWYANSVQRLRLQRPDPAPAASTLREARLAVIAERPPRSAKALRELLTTRDGVLRHDRHCDLTGYPESVTLATVVMTPASKRFVAFRYPNVGAPIRNEIRL